MAIRILTEDDKYELERKLEQAGSGSAPDVVIRTPSRVPGQLWTPEKFLVTSGSLDAVWQKGLKGQQPVVTLMYSGESEGDEIREYYPVTHISTDDMGTIYSRVAIEFLVRQEDFVWKCTLTSQGEDYIQHNVITDCRYLDDGEDLSGYATEKFVEEAIAEAGGTPDVVIQTPSTQPEVNWSAENFSVVAGSLQKAWNRGNAGQKPVVMLRWADDFGFNRNREFYEPVHITCNMIHGGTESKISLEFSVGMWGGIWNFVLTSEGESNIYADVFTGYSYSFVSSADLTGYATEDWVRQGYQPKGSYLTEVPDGYATEDFVTDKIAEAAMGGGEVDLLVAATWPFENAPASSFVVGAGSLDQLWRRALEESYNPVVYMQYDDNNEYRYGRNHYKAVHVSAFSRGSSGTPEETRIVLDFCFRQSGKLWTFSLVSQGEDNIAENRFTGYECTVLQEGSGNTDLTGYATEEFVRNKIAEAELGGEEVDLSGYAQKSELPTRTSQLYNDSGFLTEHQDISGKLDADKLPEAVNAALAQAKASGEFDGPQGEKGDAGEAGKDGVSASHRWNGTTLTITSASGTSSADLKGDKGDTGATGANGAKGDKGDKGDTGAAGYSPVRGTDYWTAADIAEIKSYVDEAILGGEW